MVVWERIKNIPTVNIKSRQLEIDQLLDQDWHVDPEENTVRASLDLGESSFVDMDVSTLVSPAGSSWRTAMFSGDAEARSLLKQYLKKIYSLSPKRPVIAIDVLHNGNNNINTILRQRVTINRIERSFEDIFNSVRGKFSEDSKEIVVGMSDRAVRAEVQLLFGAGTTVKDSPQVGDIVDHGIFFHLDGGVGVSYGINRLVCTNGLTRQMRIFDDGMLVNMRAEAVQTIDTLVGWFSALPTKKVESIRELSILLDKFPTKVLNAHWKNWSEKCDLKQLTYYEVVNDLTSYANRSLGGNRQLLINVGERFKALDKHECPTCSAHVGAEN